MNTFAQAKAAKRGRTLPKWSTLAIQTTAKPKRVAVKAKRPEEVIQAQVNAYLERMGFVYLHIPEGMFKAMFARGRAPTGPELGAMHEAADAVGGLPDNLCFHPAAPGFCLIIENKTEIGKLSKKQRDWLKATGGYCCRGFEDARAVIDAWMKERGIV